MLSDRNLPKAGQGHADVVIGFEQPKQAEVISFPIATLHYCVFASRDYLSTYGTPSGPLDVAQHRVLNHTLYAENPGWKEKTAQIAALVEPTQATTRPPNLQSCFFAFQLFPRWYFQLRRKDTPLELPNPPAAGRTPHDGVARA